MLLFVTANKVNVFDVKMIYRLSKCNQTLLNINTLFLANKDKTKVTKYTYNAKRYSASQQCPYILWDPDKSHTQPPILF